MKYTVTFAKYYTYEVEAKDKREAFDEAHGEFVNEMCNPIADTCYDEVEIECDGQEQT